MVQKNNIHVFIGYDTQQDLTWRVCRESLLETSPDIFVYKLDLNILRKLGLYSRSYFVEGNTGKKTDRIDEKNFSTEFSFSRFLVPFYADHLGIPSNDYVIFVDSDFVFLRDIRTLCESLDNRHVLHVVKHNYISKNRVKMNNQTQEAYNCKLWSSLMVFTNRDVITYTVDDVNKRTGEWLHQFKFVGSENLGEIDPAWNWIPNHSSGEPYAVHFTEGTPLHPGYEYGRYVAVFNKYLKKVLKDMERNV